MSSSLKYFWADSGSVVKTKSEKPTTPECFSHWVKIPKGSKNIHFEIPYYEVSKSEKVTKETEGGTATAVRDSLWPGDIPIQLRSLLDTTAVSDGKDVPAYAYKTWEADNNKISCFFFCRSHSASIQVFHEDGKLLSGTPLYGWDTCIGSDRFDECNGYVGGVFSSNVTASGEEIWKKCGIWAEWYSAVSTLTDGANDKALPDLADSLPATGTVVTPSDLSTMLYEHYPSVFPASFSFDDSSVNGDRQEVVKVNDIDKKWITVEGESILWTGSVGGATGIGAFDHRAQREGLFAIATNGDTTVLSIVSKPYEVLDIDEAKENLIIGFLSSDGVAGWGSWLEPDAEEDEPTPSTPIPTPTPTTPSVMVPDFEFRPVYRNFENVAPVYRGDDVVIPKPYAGVAGFRDGRYIVASRDRGKLVMVAPDDTVICTADPLARRHNADKTLCYGIALHVSERTLYMLVGEVDSVELYVVRVEITHVPLSSMPRDIHIHDGEPKPNAEAVIGTML